jgi:hypothetical protein
MKEGEEEMKQETIAMRTVSIGLRSVGVGFNSAEELVCNFVKNEGTAIISTQIKMSQEIAEQLARLIKMAISEKEFG